MNLKNIGIFIGFVLIPVTVGVIASIATSSSVDTWFQTLEKPFFNPPEWLFAPVWTSLYVLMGISSYLIYTSAQSAMRILALDVYIMQLFLNFLWSWLFFWFKSPGFALFNIILLAVVIVIMIRRFYGIHKLAGILQIPYLMWILFATALNASIWYLN
jgi:tryptophan-rich sensory protein